MLRNLPAQQDAGAEEGGQGPAEVPAAAENNVTAARATKLVLLKENTNAQEIKDKVEKTKACSFLESALFISESNKDMFEHDYARPISSKDKSKQKSRKDSRGGVQSRRIGKGNKKHFFLTTR